MQHEIVLLLKSLKKDKNWLLNFILESRVRPVASTVDSSMSIFDLLGRCSQGLLTRILLELKGIKQKYETEGYPKGFDSIPVPEFQPLTSGSGYVEELFLPHMKLLGLTSNEVRILMFLVTHGRTTASDVSRHTGIQRSETYNYMSTLVAKGVVFSTFDRPQKYYALPMDLAIDLLVQTEQNALQSIAKKKRSYLEMVDSITSKKFKSKKKRSRKKSKRLRK
jgi:hypothetical protein